MALLQNKAENITSLSGNRLCKLSSCGCQTNQVLSDINGQLPLDDFPAGLKCPISYGR